MLGFWHIYLIYYNTILNKDCVDGAPISLYQVRVQNTKNFKLYVTHTPLQKPGFFTREGIDTANSICWLFMDALWMFGLPHVGLVLSIPTILTGLALFFKERRPNAHWINLATNCWIMMNVFWMMSDTYPKLEKQFLIGSKTSLILGMCFVSIGAYKSGSISGAIAHYKRYKSFGNKKIRLL